MEIVPNEHGQSIVKVTHPSGAVCEVYLFGATVTKFVTASGRDVIWVSKKAILNGTKAIRGGMPLVFPQFGQPIKEMAQHGFARNNVWKVLSEAAPAEGSSDLRLVLGLDNEVATHEAWPHPYRLEFELVVCAESLKTTLTVHNTGDAAFKYMDLQHTYINVGDIGATFVSGLQGAQYFDKASDEPERLRVDDREQADVTQYVDRIYVPAEGRPLTDPVVIVSPLGNVAVSKSAFCTDEEGTRELPVDTVMWNPWSDKAAGMADFEEEGWLRMLCVEPGLVREFLSLSPGASASLVQVLSTTA